MREVDTRGLLGPRTQPAAMISSIATIGAIRTIEPLSARTAQANERNPATWTSSVPAMTPMTSSVTGACAHMELGLRRG